MTNTNTHTTNDNHEVDEFYPNEDSPWQDHYRRVGVRQCGRTVYVAVTDTDSDDEMVTVVSFLSANEARRLGNALLTAADRTDR